MFSGDFGETSVVGFLQKVEVTDNRDGWKDRRRKIGESTSEVCGEHI